MVWQKVGTTFSKVALEPKGNIVREQLIVDGNEVLQIKAICDMTDKELRFGHNLEKLYRFIRHFE